MIYVTAAMVMIYVTADNHDSYCSMKQSRSQVITLHIEDRYK